MALDTVIPQGTYRPRRAPIALALLAYGFVAFLLGLGIYVVVPGYRFVGQDHTRPINLPYGLMHDKELWFAEREIPAHASDTAWLAAHEARAAPIRQRVRDEQRAYLLTWALATGAGALPVVLLCRHPPRPRRSG